MKLQDKVAIITGAGSGMGKAMAILFAQEGAKVVAADINEEAVMEVVSQITESGGQAAAIKTDVTNEEDIERMVQSAVETFGSLDVLVNNSGIMDDFKTITNVSDEHWDRVLSINLTAPMKISRAAVDFMMKQEQGGVIINNASVGGLYGARGGSAYVAAKHGLVGLTKNIGAVYAKKGIRCNAIAPGGVDTNINSHIQNPDPLGLEAIGGIQGSMPRSADPMEIAQVALFLASNESSFVNGTTIVADAGWSAF
ncbi:glucose 1-dehydrogenase [Chengkuizengella axinellae]|uniref:SDR family oxidoreductase n=1 Tax=Chengkuizengella axinellae TaxID=3064388 RepID=A0ABT9J2Q7_9BACL|nr:glucose 1-dehydrogenase [Chengkuizengella sp. 2205SS18-9]MDP5275877.1 SDR family oxidoreductase [Chengkuizengella sp. 2205SS18-9]